MSTTSNTSNTAHLHLHLHPRRSAPSDYTTPPFPSLYWPVPPIDTEAQYLYAVSDAWRFTVLWTLIFYMAVHAAASAYAIAIQAQQARQARQAMQARQAWKVLWAVPVVYGLVAGVEAVFAGSVVGALIGAVYDTVDYRMSTWIPFVWGCTSTLVLILSSFSMQGAL